MEYIGGSYEKKETDFNFDEIGSGSSYKWEEKEPVSYPKRNQRNTYRCGAHTVAKILGINEKRETGTFVNLSDLAVYPYRSNKPSGGMSADDMGKIARDKGACEYDLLPSLDVTEENGSDITLSISQMQNALKYKGLSFFYVFNDIEKIAEAISTYGSVAILVYCNTNEWYRENVEYIGGEDNLHHWVTGTDAILKNGKKVIVIEDSFKNDDLPKGQRFVTDEFLKKRMRCAMIIVDDKKKQISVTPYKFAKPLVFIEKGMRGTAQDTTQMEEVKRLQDILKKEGCMNKSVPSTGRYYEMTADAVLKFQKKWGVAPLEELNQLQGKRVGNKTLAKLNFLYA